MLLVKNEPASDSVSRVRGRRAFPIDSATDKRLSSGGHPPVTLASLIAHPLFSGEGRHTLFYRAPQRVNYDEVTSQ
ncbi:hypothetical protein NPIL_316611 [Nephila pilipes]|uniref:Uncharacterized protein n=1 Tax=Nephila pilipes TaxID=299642 RepID=A0A8X6QQM1_NEPPI|nr:hypothetical protein NPIL_316611 [Nephila pilipes]